MVKRKLKKVNERAVFLLAFILLAVFALGILFVTNPKMTGNVVLGNYTNETCVAANYTWQNLTETNCTDITINCECINNSCQNCTETWGCNNSSYTNQVDCEGNGSIWQNLTETNCTDILNCECINDICQNCIETWGCVGAICGDGIVDEGEECDDGDESNGVECNPDYDDSCEWCSSDCLTLTTVQGASCGDGNCDSGEDCSSCENDCGDCESDDNDDTSTSGETSTTTGNTIKSSCVSEWQCDDWGECVEGTQTRTCTDSHNCIAKEGEPSLSQECEIVIEESELIIEETCFDEIKNQDEEGIDCGGVCEKKCSIFTMVGSVINGPIESGKEFFQKNKTIVLIISGILVLALAGFLTFGVLKKKEILQKILPKFKMLFKRKLKEEAS